MSRFLLIGILVIALVSPVLAGDINTSIAFKYEIAQGEETQEERQMLDVFWSRDSWSLGLELYRAEALNFISVRPSLTHSWQNFSATLGTCVDSLGGQNVSLGGAMFGSVDKLDLYFSAAYYRGLNDQASDFFDLYARGMYRLSSKWALGLELIDDYFPEEPKGHSVYVRLPLEYHLTDTTSVRVTPYHNWQVEGEESGLRIQMNFNF
jgi:uncharacterized membrane protein YciS (DUF1049 family)